MGNADSPAKFALEKEPSLSVWSCSARCADDTEREVLGVYQGTRCLLISRDWVGPTNPMIHTQGLPNAYPLLASMVSVADYHSRNEVWFGEIAATWLALAALSSGSRRNLHRHLQELSELGYIDYTAAKADARPSLIRIYPENRLSGDRVLSIRPDWHRDFVVSVDPRVLVADVETSGREPRWMPRVPPRADSTMADIVRDAPLFVSSVQVMPPASNLVAKYRSGNRAVIESLVEVGIFVEKSLKIILGGSLSGAEADSETSEAPSSCPWESEWRQRWTEGGRLVEIATDTPNPQAGQIGWEPSWLRPRIMNRDLRKQDSIENELLRDGIQNESHVRAAFGGPAPAPSAPPPGPPPAGNALFLRKRAERKLTAEDLAALHRRRGAWLDPARRKPLTRAQVALIEEYERVCAVPFCEADLQPLAQAQTIAPSEFIVSQIRECIRFPPQTPGYYVLRDGMAHVLNNVRAAFSALRKKNRNGRAGGRPYAEMQAESRQPLDSRSRSGKPLPQTTLPAPAPPAASPGSASPETRVPQVPGPRTIWPG